MLSPRLVTLPGDQLDSALKVPPGNMLGPQILGPDPGPTESGTLGVRPAICALTKLPCELKPENHGP